MMVDDTCVTCDGHGFVLAAEHACGGDEGMCAECCPEQTQILCPDCDSAARVVEDNDEPF